LGDLSSLFPFCVKVCRVCQILGPRRSLRGSVRRIRVPTCCVVLERRTPRNNDSPKFCFSRNGCQLFFACIVAQKNSARQGNFAIFEFVAMDLKSVESARAEFQICTTCGAVILVALYTEKLLPVSLPLLLNENQLAVCARCSKYRTQILSNEST
jgi:hypothetical protein